MKVKLLAIDLDGTLLTSDRTPHPRGAEAIQRAGRAGIQCVLASGRIQTSMLPFAKELGLENGAMICSNGGHVMGADGNELEWFPISNDAFEKVLDYAQEMDLHVNAYTRHEVLFFGESKWGELYLRRAKTMRPIYVTRDEARSREIMKLMIIDDPEAIPGHRKRLEAQLNPKDAMATESEPEYLEFLSPFASKGRALESLARTLGIRQQETAAIGDFLNDIEMIAWAGEGCAVANAAAPLKAVAKHRVSSNDDGGVAEFIDSVVLNGLE